MREVAKHVTECHKERRRHRRDYLGESLALQLALGGTWRAVMYGAREQAAYDGSPMSDTLILHLPAVVGL